MLMLTSLCLLPLALSDASFHESDSLLMRISVLDPPHSSLLHVDGHVGKSGDSTEFKQQDLKNFFDHEYNQRPAEVQQLVKQVQRHCARKKVLVSGLPRSGSTSLLTLAHIFLFFCDADYTPPSDNQSSLFVDDPQDCNPGTTTPKFCWSHFHGDRSSIVKTHIAKPDSRKTFPDVILMSSRSPDNMMASQWMAFYSQCDDPPCKDWPHAMRELERQACLYEKFDASKIKYDMQLEQLIQSPRVVFREVGAAMGVTLNGTVPAEVLNMVEKIFANVTAVIQKGGQTAHHGENNLDYREISRQMLAEGSEYHGLSSGKTTRAWLTGLQWLYSKGQIDQNPLVERTAHGAFKDTAIATKYKHQFPLGWCRNPPVLE